MGELLVKISLKIENVLKTNFPSLSNKAVDFIAVSVPAVLALTIEMLSFIFKGMALYVGLRLGMLVFG